VCCSHRRDKLENADETEIREVAEAITRYLQDRNHVADTIEGICHWWLLRQRLHDERERVERAVNYLCERGLIQGRALPNGSVLYTASNKSDKSAPD